MQIGRKVTQQVLGKLFNSEINSRGILSQIFQQILRYIV